MQPSFSSSALSELARFTAMSGPTYPLFSVFAFVGFVLGLVPLPWHLQAWNAGTCIYMMWASLACLIEFVGSVVWNGNLRNPSPVWCDIASKFLVGAGVGIPASSLCINRRLYRIASVRAVTISPRDKRRNMLVDCAIAIGLPVLVMIFHYIVQGHRFNIIEDVGCVATTFYTPATFPLVLMWPTLIGTVSFVYAALTMRAFWIRRAQFNELLSSNNSLTISRYFRLMLLSCLEMSCTIPVSAYTVYIITQGVTLTRWISWEDVHYNFSYVELIPAFAWRSNSAERISVELTRWLFPIASFLFFAIFGFADEARKQYRKAFLRVKTVYRSHSSSNVQNLRSWRNQYTKDAQSPAFTSYTTLPRPIYTHRKLTRTDSMFSSVISYNDVDLEKGFHSSSSSFSLSSSPSRTIVGGSEPESPISTNYLNLPATPPLVYEPSPSPPYRRPFSSSTILPLTAPYPT